MRIPAALGLSLGAVLLLAQGAPAQAPEQNVPLLEKKVLGLQAARKMAAAIAEAERNNWRGVVAAMWQQRYRKNSPDAMAVIDKKLDDQESAAVAAYYQQVQSTLKTAEAPGRD